MRIYSKPLNKKFFDTAFGKMVMAKSNIIEIPIPNDRGVPVASAYYVHALDGIVFVEIMRQRPYPGWMSTVCTDDSLSWEDYVKLYNAWVMCLVSYPEMTEHHIVPFVKGIMTRRDAGCQEGWKTWCTIDEISESLVDMEAAIREDLDMLKD